MNKIIDLGYEHFDGDKSDFSLFYINGYAVKDRIPKHRLGNFGLVRTHDSYNLFQKSPDSDSYNEVGWLDLHELISLRHWISEVYSSYVDRTEESGEVYYEPTFLGTVNHDSYPAEFKETEAGYVAVISFGGFSVTTGLSDLECLIELLVFPVILGGIRERYRQHTIEKFEDLHLIAVGINSPGWDLEGEFYKEFLYSLGCVERSKLLNNELDINKIVEAVKGLVK